MNGPSRCLGGFVLALASAATVLAAPFAYVTNERSNSVSVIDTATQKVVATVPVGAGPYGVAVSPSGNRAYVANRLSDDVSVIDTTRNVVAATVAVGWAPTGLAVHPAGTRVYVTNLFSSTVAVIDTATGTVVDQIALGGRPRGIAVNPAGTRLYVTTIFPGSVAVIDTATDAVVATLPLGRQLSGVLVEAHPAGVATSADGTHLYVAVRNAWGGTPPPCDPPADAYPPPPCGSLAAFGSVLVVDATTNQVIGTVFTPGIPYGIAVDPAGSRVYATLPDENLVVEIDHFKLKVAATITVDPGPHGIAAGPGGTALYVATTAADSVAVIDTATLTVTARVRVGMSPVAFGAFVGPPPALPAIEYYHRGYDHYFVTAGEGEIALLDAGHFSGWARTGESFRVAPVGSTGAADVCRFWSGNTFAPKSSHFYTPDAAECEKVKRNPDWTYEHLAFALAPPDAAGRCATDRLPLYRLYNDGMSGAPNHRYTVSLVIRSAMVAKGWIPEPVGTMGVIGCVGPP